MKEKLKEMYMRIAYVVIYHLWCDGLGSLRMTSAMRVVLCRPPKNGHHTPQKSRYMLVECTSA